MTYRLISAKSVFVCLSFFLITARVEGAEPASPESRLKKAEISVSSIEGTLKKFVKAVAKAREENDIKRLNCLMTKMDLVKGFLKASERAKVVLMESSFAGDAKTADMYGQKIGAYGKNTSEIENSIEECYGVGGTGDGTTVVYIRPSGEGMESADGTVLSPFGEDDLYPAEGYPAVPPASPFR
ncbi:MAG TPA: hypothetical protein VI895_14425 [Bdellovibrionota bacterium]|nr:hypothetical protein [Bdellovibrionota bacterium]